MFSILAVMFLGIAMGYLVRRWRAVRYISATTMLTILLLLFFMGKEVGANRMLMQNLFSLGGDALLIALAGVAGSVLAAACIYKYMYKSRNRADVE